jgi:hypothetical protein
MRNIFFILILILCILSCASSVHADTHAAASCSQAHVEAAIAAASRGDTVTVPAGSCSWAEELVIDKSIIFQGAGAGTTVITSTQAANGICGSSTGGEACSYMIKYAPATIADDKDTLFRITGFTLDADFKVGNILVYNPSTTAHNKVRIDNNALTDGNYATGTSGSDTRASVMIRGTVYGVMDNNTIGTVPIIRIYGPASTAGKSMWEAFGMYQPGTSQTFFVEDNTITWDYPSHTDWSRTLDSTGYGSSWVARYNDYIANPASSALVMIWDSHPGVDNFGTFATRGKEVYGNDMTGMGRFSPRCNGGQTILFYNRDNDTSATYVPTLVTQMDYANEPGLTACGSNAVSSEVGRTTCAAAVSGYTMPQHPHREYEWANWWGATPTKWPGFVSSGAIALRNDIDYFNYNLSFGERTAGNSSGVGCGTLAARPATCTTGIAYWATSQSCSDIANYVGKAPTTPISGTLYRCSTTDTWSAYYTPYTYPHPLRGGADTTAPIMSSPCAGAGSCVSPIIEIPCADASEPYTADVSVGIQTNENATVKYNADRTNGAYAAMDSTMTGAGGTTHTATLAGLACGASYTLYGQAQDTATNTTEETNPIISFTIASKAGTKPTLTDLSGTTQAYNKPGQLLKVHSSVAATCRYTTVGAGTAWADRTAFGITGDTIQHSSSISQAASSTVTYHVLCQDSQGIESDNLAISITTTAGSVITFSGGTSKLNFNDGGNTTIAY